MPLQVVVRDIYKERDVGRFTGTFSDIVEAHGVLALRLTPTKCCSALTLESTAQHASSAECIQGWDRCDRQTSLLKHPSTSL